MSYLNEIKRYAFYSLLTLASVIAINGCTTEIEYGRIIARIEFESVGNNHMAILPSGEYVYVSNFTAWVRVLRTSNNEIVDSLEIPGNGALYLAADPGGQYVYATGFHAVSVIETSNNTVVDTVPLSGAQGIVVDPSGDFAYVGCEYDSGEVKVVRLVDRTIIDSISVGICPLEMSVLPNSEFLYVLNYYGHTISVIRLSDRQVIATIETAGYYPSDITALPNSEYVYVTNGSDDVYIIRTSDNVMVGTITGSQLGCRGIVASPDGDYVYVCNYTDRSISIVRVSDNLVIGSIDVTDRPLEVVIHPGGGYLYVVNMNSITVIELSLD
jgi:YVTN family beta-propeller protein